MPERDGYIPGVPCWIDTSQPDPESAVAFYREHFDRYVGSRDSGDSSNSSDASNSQAPERV